MSAGMKLTMKDIETAIGPYRMSDRHGQTTVGIRVFKEIISLAGVYPPSEINRLARVLQFELAEWSRRFGLEQEQLSPAEDSQ